MKPDDGHCRPKHVVLYLLAFNIYSNLTVVFLTTSPPNSLHAQRRWHTSKFGFETWTRRSRDFIIYFRPTNWGRW